MHHRARPQPDSRLDTPEPELLWRKVSIDSTASCSSFTIRNALDASPNGLSRDQIRILFHGHVTSDRIDAALEQLASLGAIASHTSPGRGRPGTLWSPVEAEDDAPE
jgi:hypothetical protein